ncbi:MAG TPA: MMPL family transporter [Hyphomicrobiaceae bacterium]|nr:MMPL family transporter [Hyphomicrobiaceae bacterium]
MDAPGRRFAFTFGLERLGLLALRAPAVSGIIILLVCALAFVGVSRLKVDDSLSELFRTDTAEFRDYETIDRLFPSSEYDVLVVVEGRELLSRAGLEALSRTMTELQLADGVNGLVSMLSARGKPDATGYAPPIVPDDIPQGPALTEIVDRLRTNDIVKGKFLSEDGLLALAVISLDRSVVEQQGAKTIIGGIRETAEKHLEGSGLRAQLTGAPVMQLEIRNAVERDRLVYNGLGFLVGAAIAFVFFRRLSLTLIAVLGPSIAILWTLGAIGGLDFRLNLFINVITPLILVSGFSDSMHLVFAIRRDIMNGVDRVTAARNAVVDVAPACLLTAMNAALALVSFAFADSALIRTFGIAALMAVGISYLAVAVVVPTLAALLIRREAATATAGEANKEGGIGVLGHATEAIVRTVIARPALWSLIGTASVAAAGILYSQLVPSYRLADQVPDKEQALAATDRLDQKLTGANPVHVMIRWKGDQSLFEQRTLDVIAAAHAVLEKQAGLGNVWSIESLRRWLAEAGDTRIETVQRYVKVLPEHLTRRFISEDGKAVLVTGRLPDVDASQILPVVDLIDKALTPVRQAHPGYEVVVTGLPAIAARNSARLIGELNWGLVGDMFVIFIFLGIALRSLLAGVTSVLPSLFPIFATGALMKLGGEGLQFASIIAITVAFALAIDSTIHFLNRFHIEEARPDTANVQQALIRTVNHIGPVVVLTTIVLALGLGVTVLSHLPSLRLFGRLAGICLFASLIGQLVILPATIALYRSIWPRTAG